MQSIEQVVSSPQCQMVGWNDFCALYSLLVLLFGNLVPASLVYSLVPECAANILTTVNIYSYLKCCSSAPVPQSHPPLFQVRLSPDILPKGHLDLKPFSHCQPLGLITSLGFFQVLQQPLHLVLPLFDL